MVTPKENQYHQHLPQDDKQGDPFAKKLTGPHLDTLLRWLLCSWLVSAFLTTNAVSLFFLEYVKITHTWHSETVKCKAQLRSPWDKQTGKKEPQTTLLWEKHALAQHRRAILTRQSLSALLLICKVRWGTANQSTQPQRTVEGSCLLIKSLK